MRLKLSYIESMPLRSGVLCLASKARGSRHVLELAFDSDDRSSNISQSIGTASILDADVLLEPASSGVLCS